MSEFTVIPAELIRKAEELRTLNAQFKTKVEELSSLEVNLSSMWEGEARDLFRTIFTADKSQWENYATLIEQYCAALEKIGNAYGGGEKIALRILSERNS